MFRSRPFRSRLSAFPPATPMSSLLFTFPIPRWAAAVTVAVGCLLQLLLMVVP